MICPEKVTQKTFLTDEQQVRCENDLDGEWCCPWDVDYSIDILVYDGIVPVECRRWLIWLGRKWNEQVESRSVRWSSSMACVSSGEDEREEFSDDWHRLRSLSPWWLLSVTSHNVDRLSWELNEDLVIAWSSGVGSTVLGLWTWCVWIKRFLLVTLIDMHKWEHVHSSSHWK